MRVLSLLVSAIILVIGLFFLVSSLSVELFTGTHSALIGCGCFLFVIALGVWQNNSAKHEEKMEQMMIDLIRRQSVQPQNYQQSTGQYPPVQPQQYPPSK